MPSLTATLAATGQVATDALTGAGLVALEPVVYHGPIPDEADCVSGRVAVWWTRLGIRRRVTPNGLQYQCGEPTVVEATVRWSLCWPVDTHATALHFTAAQQLADGAWVGHGAFAGLTCGTVAVPEGVAPRGLSLVATEPRAPRGGVAAVDWKLRVRVVLDPADVAGP